MKISIRGREDPFASLVGSFLANQFPGAVSRTTENIVDAVAKEVLGTNQHRYGPLPGPESMVSIRQVIRASVERGTPIPVLTPFGSRKTVNGESVDIAEVMTLRQLDCLQRRVQQFYPPGMTVNLRLEDASGHYLFADEGELSRKSTDQYCRDFVTLVRVLGGEFVHPILESDLFSDDDFTRVANEIVPHLVEYITATDTAGLGDAHLLDAWKQLNQHGWHGAIPVEQREYYRARYRSIYPGITEEEATMKLARYLAGSLARIKLGGSGADRAWGNDYIRVTFVPPVPGAPTGLTSRNVYYRTVPLRFGATHLPAWRAKGYLKIGSADEVCPKLMNWNTAVQAAFQPCVAVFERDDESVDVKTDYLLE